MSFDTTPAITMPRHAIDQIWSARNPICIHLKDTMIDSLHPGEVSKPDRLIYNRGRFMASENDTKPY